MYTPDQTRYETMPYHRCGDSGLKLPAAIKPYFQFVLPVLILIILIQGLL